MLKLLVILFVIKLYTRTTYFGKKDKQKVTVSFIRKLLIGQIGNSDQIAPDLCNSISHDPLYRYLQNVK